MEDVNSLLGRGLKGLGQALGVDIPETGMTVQKSMGCATPPADRAVGHTGSQGPAPRVPHQPHPSSARAHTHRQPASYTLKRPGLTRREGASQVGGPGRIQLHLFTPIGHRLVAAGW